MKNKKKTQHNSFPALGRKAEGFPNPPPAAEPGTVTRDAAATRGGRYAPNQT